MDLKRKVGFEVSQFILEGFRGKGHPGPDTTGRSSDDIFHPDIIVGMYDVQPGV